MTEQHSPEVEIDENQLIAERQKKLALIRESERPTFPNDFRRSHRAGELAAAHGHEEKDEFLKNQSRLPCADALCCVVLWVKRAF